MKITIDRLASATYVKLTNKKIVKTIEQGKYYIDLDKDGGVVGVEYLSIPKIKETSES